MVISPFLLWWAVMGMGACPFVPAHGSGGLMRFLVEQGIYERHGYGCQAQWLAVARAREDYVFHAGATEALGRLFAEHPTDGIAQVRLATAVGAYHRCDAAAIEAELRAVTERLEALQFDAL